jgi:glycosyltransferase involved in cell wall biosynthesis
MVVSSLLEFGGLEEFAKDLAVGIQEHGHAVSVLSTAWVPPNNQYLRSLREHNVTYVQLPRWLSLAASDWETKEKMRAVALVVLFPLIVLLGFGAALVRRQPIGQSIASARNWMQGQLMRRVIGPDWRQPFVRLMLRWWRFNWKPDVLHIHGYTSTLLFVIDWAHAHKLPVIYEEHQTPDAQFDWWKDFKTSINKASIVVGVSEKSAQALREVCGVTRPVVVAYYMVADPYKVGWKDLTNPQESQLKITTVARLYVTKGLTYLLETIALVKAVHPNAQFKVYGDGPLRDELLAYAEKLGLDGKQIFVGAFTSRAQLADIMAHTDIFLMSSILEGLPISLLEAMSYGRAIVTTPAGGIREAIQDGVNGLICEARDPKCLAANVNCLAEDAETRQKLGRAARLAYEQGPFSPNAVCNQYVSIYQQAMSMPSPE